MKKEQKLLVIVGPTSSGKSALAVALAKKFKGEIISADSRQVYRGLDIGTGKITKKEMRGISHYLLDIASPKKNVTAHKFAELARAAIAKIASHDSIPVVTGGTGFYIDALVGRVALPDVAQNAKLRNKLRAKTAAQLYAMLKKKDPKRARGMNTPSERGNKVRLIRALEIASSKKDKVRMSSKGSPCYEVLWIGIRPTKEKLEQRIRARLKKRVRQGLIVEGKRLYAQGLSYKRMEELGLEYRALSRLLQKKISRKEFEEGIVRDSRRYAKKQLAYWKRNGDILWYDPKQKVRIVRDIAAWLRMR